VGEESLVQIAERALFEAEQAYRSDPSEANQRRIMRAWSAVRSARERLQHVAADRSTEAPPALSVKGVCFNDAGDVLLCRNWRNEWELPGGRPEPGESYAQCLEREFAEETGLSVEVQEAIGAPHPFEVIPGRRIEVVAYRCRLRALSAPRASAEHDSVRFVPVHEIGSLPLPGIYRRAIEAVVAVQTGRRGERERRQYEQSGA
jgi:8-oxo-dGTP pyrophosphatase MutT (NUDIX family)